MILCGKNSTALLPKPPHQEYYWWVGTPCRFIWPTWAHGWVTHLFLQWLSRQHLGVFTRDIVTGYKPIVKTEEMSNTTSINFGWRETSIYRIYRSFQKNPSFPVIKSELIITVILIWHERSISATCQLRWFKALIGGMKSVALGLITTQSSWISYLGIMRFTVPIGKISIDFPQNLFFHLTSEKQISEKHQKWKSTDHSNLCIPSQI